MSSKKLIADVATATGLSQAKTKGLLDAIGASVTDSLKLGEDVTLPGLGKLKAKRREARVGRNPASGEDVQIPAKNLVKFTAAKSLKDAVA